MGDDRPPVYYELDDEGNTNLIIRTSAIGSTCLWELVAAGQGYEMSPVPDTLQRAFDEGNMLEPLIIGMLESKGWTVTDRQAEGELVIEPGLTIRYHPDGKAYHLTHNESARVLEVKALSNALWQTAARHSVGKVFAEYDWQLSVMMHQSRLPGLWVAFNKGNADGSPCTDQGKLLFERVDRPPISLDEITTKAQLIKSQVEGEDLLVSGRPCDDPTHYPCRFLYIRPEPEEDNLAIDQPTILTVPDELKDEVDHLVKEYLVFKGQADEAKIRQDAAKTRLIEIAGNSKKMLTDKFIIPVVNGSNTSPDWAAMPQALKDEVNKYKKTTPYRYLRGIKPLD